MKKLFTRTMLLLCALIAGSASAWADSMYSLTPNATNTERSETSYLTSLTEFTYSDISWKMAYWNPSTLQVKTNQSKATEEFRFYNTSAFPGRIKQVVITFSALTIKTGSDSGFMFKGGTSEVTKTTGGTAGTWDSTKKVLTWTPASTDDFTFFAFYLNGKVASGNNFLAESDAIVVTYESASPLASIAVSGNYPTTFHQGDVFSHDGAVVTATYDNSNTKDVTANAIFSTPDMSTTGTKPVTVSYTESEVTKTTSYNITVNAPATLTGIALSGDQNTEFNVGSTFSYEGLVVTASYDDETSKVVSGYTVSSPDMSTVGTKTITVSYTENGVTKTATYDITVSEKPTYDFVKVTDASTLRAGDQLLVVYESTNVALGAVNTSGTNHYYAKVGVTRDAGAASFTVEDEAVAFLTLGGEEDAWTLKSSLSNNYLSLPSNANALSESATATSDNQKWKISISSGDATITNVQFASNTRFIQYNKNSGSERFACYQGTQQNVQLYRLSKSVTITAAEYATYAGAKALNFNGVGIKVYTATDEETKVTLNEVTSGKVPANTPVVLYKAGADGTAINVPVIDEADAISGTNDLRVSTGTDVENMYVLAKYPTIGFYPWTGTNLSAGKIYLQGKASYGARDFIGFGDGETTAINALDPRLSTLDQNTTMYNLAGQKVSNSYKGIVIVNGRKYIRK